jgi:hypothetical protein
VKYRMYVGLWRKLKFEGHWSELAKDLKRAVKFLAQFLDRSVLIPRKCDSFGR